MMKIFDRFESEVRSYCRSFPTVFTRGSGYRLFDETDREYLDFFSGAGALNYGHNHPELKRRLIEYLEQDGVTHSLDMATAAKREFLERFHRIVLRPRGLDYKVQFTGPTGTNAVEAALKLARKVKRRPNVAFFTNAYHGMTLGALAVTGNAAKRAGAGVPLDHAVPVPFEGYRGAGRDSLEYLESLLDDSSSGFDRPAAVIVETVQAEGGINVASFPWLRRLAALTRAHDVLLIVDEVQVGCGRTGTFFSFEPAGIEPDVVCLSKSIGGFGLPMALVLLRPELDVWSPGEHNGTFRGNNLAFVAAAAALDYWEDDSFAADVRRKSELACRLLEEVLERHPESRGSLRGRGLILGLDLPAEGLASRVSRAAFRRGLVIETAGARDNVLKLLPPLIIDDVGLRQGIDILEAALAEALEEAPAEHPEAFLRGPALLETEAAP
ncbi:MAG TPA: diaminobutyrate--2-oxoglutarate transaminase [Thermoanaerobaculia bacterium]|nr:diaminobutyrate--2-oxoglutarate transaminase [Thermoanaerobaculia bacterium]